MENENKLINELLDNFDKSLFKDANIDIDKCPIRIEYPDRNILEKDPYAE